MHDDILHAVLWSSVLFDIAACAVSLVCFELHLIISGRSSVKTLVASIWIAGAVFGIYIVFNYWFWPWYLVKYLNILDLAICNKVFAGNLGIYCCCADMLWTVCSRSCIVSTLTSSWRPTHWCWTSNVSKRGRSFRQTTSLARQHAPAARTRLYCSVSADPSHSSSPTSCLVHPRRLSACYLRQGGYVIPCVSVYLSVDYF